MEVFEISKLAKTVKFMTKPIYDFEQLRKKNQYFSRILKATEIEILLLDETPLMNVLEMLSDTAERIDCVELLKRGSLVRMNEFITLLIDFLHHRIMSEKRHSQLK